MQLAHLPSSPVYIQNNSRFVSARINDEHRSALENTVKEGFLVAYNATLTSFMPLLCQYTTNEGQCTLGLRQATSPLFIEQYLASPVEDFLNESISRNKIFELGNLCSTNRRATLAHFIIVNEALQSVGAKHLVFCATNKVRALLRLLGVTCTEIALASSFVVENPLKWGSYYANQPTVCIASLEQAHQQVLNTPMLFSLMQQNHSNINSLVNALVNV
ncbi:thermostable hemolysin [Pseudoalteromonas sp. SR43-2]|uniref:thermostable hemolysin n=1 Tax=Pseudoalteromonas sp. SR43-2 TaxID=2760944 RepID=UPI0015FBD8D2|nr:thermostable hemolysin [Pseudoalteromonas sp. SR43-2]MBB1379019.1 thermostable hemolysin [Pseudoalteromonas sp. SR43-2]